MSTVIRQSVTLHATPREVFETLMDSRKHGKFTGGPAKISRVVGGKVSVYGGYATGENLELSQDRKIVQSWRAGDWPEGHYSRVTFRLTRVKGGTRITFTQSGVPAGNVAGIRKGWIDYYWTPLRSLFPKK
jgi:activator of HSP90 ATPase